MELVFIDGGLGDDVVAINVVDTVAPASSLPFNVIGNAPNASDRLIVNDDGLGDLVIHRQASDGRSGSIVIGSTTRAGGFNSAIEPPKCAFLTSRSSASISRPSTRWPHGRLDAGGHLIRLSITITFEHNDSLTTATMSAERRAGIGAVPLSVCGISIQARSALCRLPSPASPAIPTGTSSARTELALSASKCSSSRSTPCQTGAPACRTTAI